MGAWGTGILQDDLAADVYGDFMDAYDERKSPEEISPWLIDKYTEVLSSDEAPSFWLALAQAQWECGQLDPNVARRVKAIADSQAGLSGWLHEPDRKRRAQVISRFILQIATPPKRVRRPVRHRAPRKIFDPGTCLAVALCSGGYGAAIVLDVDDTSSKREIHSLVGILDGWFESRPPLTVFEERNWLFLTHHNFKNERAIIWCNSRSYKQDAALFTVVGSTTIRSTDPKVRPWSVGSVYSSWGVIESKIRMQVEWDSKHGRPTRTCT